LKEVERWSEMAFQSRSTRTLSVMLSKIVVIQAAMRLTSRRHSGQIYATTPILFHEEWGWTGFATV
jgi:hypothetical protein